MKSSLRNSFLLIIIAVLQSCEKPDCGCTGLPLASNLVGRWEWVQTVSSSNTLTPESVGYSQEFNFGNDGSMGDYVTLYRNDSLFFKGFKDRNFLIEDQQKSTLLLHIGNKYQKYYLKKSTVDNVYREVELSQLMDEYSEAADTVRSFYRYVGVPRK